MGVLALGLLALGTLACGSSSARLRVDLRTDWVPGLEFHAVDVRIFEDADQTRLVTETRTTVDLDSPAFDGLRVADARVSRGTRYVFVRLLDATDGEVASRLVIAEVRGATGVTALITRNCLGVVCPRDDASATECLGGECVRPECSPENPDACPPPDCDATECPTGPACTAAECLSGACVLRTRRATCAAGEVCDPIEGCVPVGGGMDASIDATTDAELDAGMDVGTDVGTDAGASCSDLCPGTCVDATCVVSNPLTFTCPPGLECEVECMFPGACSGVVQCGASNPRCDIRCSGSGSCVAIDCAAERCDITCDGSTACSDIVCGASDRCNIDCTGLPSCSGSIECGPGRCDISCSGLSCSGSIDCDSSCACDVTCSTCSATCRSPCQAGNQCDRDLPGCDTCP